MDKCKINLKYLCMMKCKVAVLVCLHVLGFGASGLCWIVV